MRQFLRVLTRKIEASNVLLDAKEIASVLDGMRSMTKDCNEVKALFETGACYIFH